MATAAMNHNRQRTESAAWLSRMPGVSPLIEMEAKKVIGEKLKLSPKTTSFPLVSTTIPLSEGMLESMKASLPFYQEEEDAVKRMLLAAKTIAYSDSASGVYVSTEMFDKLGIKDAMQGKARKIPATPVGEIVAHGEAEIGFQQVSELVHIPGIDYIGPLPPDIQCVTVFSCGLQTGATEPDAAKALVAFLATPAAKNVMMKHGLETA